MTFDSLGVGITTAKRCAMPAPPEQKVYTPGPHFLDYRFVTEGNDDIGVEPGRKLDVGRWNNSARSVIRAGGLTDDESLYVLARTLEGFIWVPRSGRPALTTILSIIVGTAGEHTLYKHAVDRAATHNSNSTQFRTEGVGITAGDRGKNRGSDRRPAEPFELWAVPKTMHDRRSVAPAQSVAQSIHALFSA